MPDGPAPTWEECYADPEGTVYVDEAIGADADGGRITVRGLIMRCLCRPTGWWWYGWDYGHAFDATWIRRPLADQGAALPDYALRWPQETAWSVEMILPEMREAAKALLELARACWRPSQAEQDEQAERDGHLAEWISDPRGATERLQNGLAKAKRLRRLDGEA